MAWKTFNYHWQWQLKSTAEVLWPFVADTQRFNQASGLPAIDYSEVPLEIGGSRRLGRTARWRVMVEFEDFPFDWVKGQSFSNVRVFNVGPLAKTIAHLSLEPNEIGTLLNYDIEVTPANLLGWIGIPYQFGWEMRRKFGQIFCQIDDYLQQAAEKPFALAQKSLNDTETKRLSALTKKLTDQGYNLQWVQALVELLTNEPDSELARLRPYVLADAWQAPRNPVLEMFLSAAKLGLLNMRWDVMCPLCRGAKTVAPSLDEIRRGTHCPTCNIDFEADFTKNVELTFTPHPQIRLIETFEYCIGGPMVTPHILIHQTLQPGETRSLEINSNLQGFRFRTQRPGVEQWFTLLSDEAGSIKQIEVAADIDSIQVTPSYNKSEAKQPLRLLLTNKAPYSQQIYMERSDWFTNAVTAAQVTTLQHFRDLFSDEVLRPGEEIGVQGITVLFSDLIGSTAMYNQFGDAPSYALVREQFAFLQGVVRRYNGGIVKTIGDAIMAAFVDPADAIKAALAIQQEVGAFNETHPYNPVAIKLGLYHGPCIAVNLNGRLDYFGTTVNLAARLEGQSQGNDVVVSEELLQDPAVERLLDAMAIERLYFKAQIKGFSENFRLCRLIWGQGNHPAKALVSDDRLEHSL